MTTEPIQFDFRFFMLNRAISITDYFDALVEIVTNSVDAYKKTTKSTFPIEIEISSSGKQLIVRDFALGMTNEEARILLGVVGSESSTTDDTTRGYFSRGAKDITALGKVTFDCVKNNKWSQIVLNHDLTITHGVIVDSSELPGGFEGKEAGVCVTIDLLESLTFTMKESLEKIVDDISQLIRLRNVFSDERTQCTLRYGDEAPVPIAFQYPDSTKLDDIHFKVPGYEEYSAHFELHVTSTEIPSSTDSRRQVSGFEIKSESGEFDFTFFNGSLQFHEYSHYFFGSVSTEGIRVLLLDFEQNGPSPKNPTLILDPGRKGLNADHPFISQLYSIPQMRFRIALDLKSDENTVSNSGSLTTDFRLDAIEIAGSELLKSEIPFFFQHSIFTKEFATAVRNVDNQYRLDNLHETDARVFSSETNINNESNTETNQETLLEKDSTPNSTSIDTYGLDVYYGQITDMLMTESEHNRGVDVAPHTSSPILKIEYMETLQGEKKYILRKTARKVCIQINMSHPIIARVAPAIVEGVYHLNTEAVKLMVIQIVVEALTWLIIQEDQSIKSLGQVRQEQCMEMNRIFGLVEKKVTTAMTPQFEAVFQKT